MGRALAQDGVGPFYPEGSNPGDFLGFYSREFSTVEVDSTYYGIPAAVTVDRWRDKTPEGFIFAAKFPRTIVHGGTDAKPDPKKVLDPEATAADCDAFLEVMGRMGARLGPLLLQFPLFLKDVFPSLQHFLGRLDGFMEKLPRDFRYAIETRNRDWLGPELLELCRRYRSALVLTDQAWMPHADELPKRFDPITTNFAYIRLLGNRKRIEAITKAWEKEVIDHGKRLERWAGFIRRLEIRCVRTLVYANNHYAGHAPTTVRRLTAMLERNRGIAQ